MKKLLTISGIMLCGLLMASCTSKQAKHLLGHAIADGANTQVRYSPAQCRTLKMRCVQGDFQEWQTSDKEMGCSCKKL